MSRRYWPAALALLIVAVLGSYLLFTEHLAREIRAETAIHTRMYALVQQGLLSLEPEAELETLLELQEQLKALGVPIVAVSADGEPYAAANLPFAADLTDPADRRRVLEYAVRLDRQNRPIAVEDAGTVHFGAPPILGWLRWIPWLQVGGGLLLLAVAVALLRANLRAERERMFAVMAREPAHQMGTPLSSLAGWVEMLRLPPAERAALAAPEHIAEQLAKDVAWLERVSRRFELIGKPPVLEDVPAGSVIDDLEEYLRPRLPRLTAGVRLRLRADSNLPPVRANRVLLVWALENLVKNALDALAGRGGHIRVVARCDAANRVTFYVADNGPGISARVRSRLFEPGITTKSGGWGVGLSLTRRIIELHGGKISMRLRRGGGTVFQIELPAPERRAHERVLSQP